MKNNYKHKTYHTLDKILDYFSVMPYEFRYFTEFGQPIEGPKLDDIKKNPYKYEVVHFAQNAYLLTYDIRIRPIEENTDGQ